MNVSEEDMNAKKQRLRDKGMCGYIYIYALYISGGAAIDDATTTITGLSDAEIEKLWDERYLWMAASCRKHVPAPDVLLQAFDQVCKVFATIPDSETKKPLFSDKVCGSMAAWLGA